MPVLGDKERGVVGSVQRTKGEPCHEIKLSASPLLRSAGSLVPNELRPVLCAGSLRPLDSSLGAGHWYWVRCTRGAIDRPRQKNKERRYESQVKSGQEQTKSGQDGARYGFCLPRPLRKCLHRHFSGYAGLRRGSRRTPRMPRRQELSSTSLQRLLATPGCAGATRRRGMHGAVGTEAATH